MGCTASLCGHMSSTSSTQRCHKRFNARCLSSSAWPSPAISWQNLHQLPPFSRAGSGRSSISQGKWMQIADRQELSPIKVILSTCLPLRGQTVEVGWSPSAQSVARRWGRVAEWILAPSDLRVILLVRHDVRQKIVYLSTSMKVSTCLKLPAGHLNATIHAPFIEQTWRGAPWVIHSEEVEHASVLVDPVDHGVEGVLEGCQVRLFVDRVHAMLGPCTPFMANAKAVSMWPNRRQELDRQGSGALDRAEMSSCRRWCCRYFPSRGLGHW